MRGLYPIVDVDSLTRRRISVVDFAREVLVVRPALLQLRAKSTSPREALELLRALRPLCTESGTLLFANDRPDLALLGECDGVHVGQSDLAAADVRRLAPRLKLGISTHDLSQLAAALLERPDYVAFGPIFETGSKQNPDAVVGLAGLGQAAALARQSAVPLVAIGGITLERAASVAETGALCAVIAALLPQSDELAEVSRRARQLAAALQGAGGA